MGGFFEQARVRADRLVGVVRAPQVEDGPEDDLAGAVVGRQAAAVRFDDRGGEVSYHAVFEGYGERPGEAGQLVFAQRLLPFAERVGWCRGEGYDEGRRGAGRRGGFPVEKGLAQGGLEI